MASFKRSVLVSVSFTLFGGPGIILVYLPFAITRFRLPASLSVWQLATAVGLIVVGLIPLLESIVRFVRVGRGTLMPNVPTERLVISGLYRYVRNPMYVGDLMVLLGEALLLRSWRMVGYAVFVWVVLEIFIRRYEEPTLTRRHGQEYLDYCARVPRWWPRILAHPV
jgi:protein-S-isoprenylcysteine O-methyltransferase Ste14